MEAGGQTFKNQFSDFPGEIFCVLKEKEEKEFGEYRPRYLFWKRGTDCMEGRPDCLNEEKKSIINFDHKIEI